METSNSFNKLNGSKVIDTINFNGKYMDVSAFKSKIITASAISAFLASCVAFIFIFFA